MNEILKCVQLLQEEYVTQKLTIQLINCRSQKFHPLPPPLNCHVFLDDQFRFQRIIFKSQLWLPVYQFSPSLKERTDVIMCVCVLMPTHCTIMRFGFRSRRIDGVQCGLFSNHAPLGQTTLRVGRVSVQCTVAS